MVFCVALFAVLSLLGGILISYPNNMIAIVIKQMITGSIPT
jgi:hypothetical protein